MNGSENMPQNVSKPAGTDTPDTGQHYRRRRRSNSPIKRARRFLRRMRLRQRLPRVLVVLVVLILVIIVGGLVVATDAVSRVQTSFNRLQQVVSSTANRPGTDLTLDDLSLVRASLGNFISTLTDVQRQANLVRPVLALNKELTVNLTYQDTALQLAQSANSMLDGLEPTLFFLAGQETTPTVVTQITSGQRIVDLLRLGLPRIVSAQTNLQAAQKSLDSIDRSTLSASLLLQLEQLQSYYSQLNKIQSVLMVAPDLLTTALGLDSPQTYLVLSENSDELRPSGGFLSTYGWLTITNGRVENYDYSPSTTDNPHPPPDSMAS